MSCRIELNDYSGGYYSGTIIHGRVICSLDTVKNIKGVEIKLKGKEKNTWWNSQRRITKTNTFLKSQHVLEGPGNLGPGTFVYPFSFELPTDLPTTFEGPYGGVYFTIKAIVDMPSLIDFNYKDKKFVNIISPVNLNAIASDLRLTPNTYSNQKTVCCLCCASGPITMEVHLEKEAFAIGETVKINVVINNLSNKNVGGVVAKLILIMDFRSATGGGSRHLFVVLAETSDTTVCAYGETTYNLHLYIPEDTLLPNFQRCKLFSQRTQLKVDGVLKNSLNLDIPINVSLGHIPVSGQGEYNPIISNQPTFTNQLPFYISPSDPPTSSNQNPPPYSPFAPVEYPQKPTSAGTIGLTVTKDVDVPPYTSNSRSAPLSKDSASAKPKTDMA